MGGKPHEDYEGYDHNTPIGRIYLDQQTLKAGRWYWSIQYPRGGRPYQPNFGWEATAPEAAKVVEDLWDAMLLKLKEERKPVPQHVEEFKGYRIAIYSPLDHYAVITPPGGNAVMDFGPRRAVATVVEGYAVCLDRAKALVDELTMETCD